MPPNKSKKGDSSAAKKITDSRFANFESDPRFRLPSKHKTKTTIDKRFASVLKDDDFIATAKVDRYGRKLQSDHKKKALQRLYQQDDEEEEEEDGDELEVEDDDVVRRELAKADKAYDPARGGGFSSSSEDSDSDEDEDEDEGEEAQVDDGSGMQRFQNEQAEVPSGEVTNRIAIVNLDWDHIKAEDLMALFSSFAPAGGRIEKVSIYPSEFGKERMQREELEGPPKEIFKKAKSDGEDSEDDEDDSSDDGDDDVNSDEEVKNELIKEEDDQDFDSDALRSYQLDRLRYYYAVMVCSDKGTAEKIYNATDGTEYLSSSNFIDLRFVPDDVTFDDEPREECTSVPSGYKPIDFVTDALQHSKVKLTWDLHPEEASRKESMKQAFSGSRADIAENDLRAYLASDTESDGEGFSEPDEPSGEADGEPKLSKKELARRKMREALGLTVESSSKASKDGPVGDMEVTFTPALSGKPGAKGDDSDKEETTVEKYLRKERERKEERRKKAKAKREGRDADAVEEEEQPKEDLGFDDPFFTAEEPGQTTKSSMRKEERLKKRAAKQAEEEEKAAQKAQLELLMADNEDASRLNHFDMNEIKKAEKRKGKKKGRKGQEERGGLQEDFQMDVSDSRFKAVFENHEFAIDPSNPKFTETPGMKKLLEEGRKKRKLGDVEVDAPKRSGKDQKKAKVVQEDLGDLVARVKNRSGKK